MRTVDNGASPRRPVECRAGEKDGTGHQVKDTDHHRLNPNGEIWAVHSGLKQSIYRRFSFNTFTYT